MNTPEGVFLFVLASAADPLYDDRMVDDASLERYISEHYGALSGDRIVTSRYLRAARELTFGQFSLPSVIDDPGAHKGRRAQILSKPRKVAQFPVLRVVNRANDREASEVLNVAELVIEGKLPLVLSKNPENQLLIARMSFLNLRLAEQVGIDPLHVAALTPDGLMSIADVLADITTTPEPQEAALTEIQDEIIRKVARGWHASITDVKGTVVGDRLQLIQTAELEVVEAYLAEEAAKRSVTFLYGRQPFVYDDEREAYYAVASSSQGVRIAANTNREIAANQALRVVAGLPEERLGSIDALKIALEAARLKR